LAERAGRNLRLRVYSASILVPLAIGAAIAGSPLFTVTVAGVAVFLALEWDRLCRRRDDAGSGGGAVLAAAMAVLVLIGSVQGPVPGLLGCLAAGGLVAAAARLDGQDVVVWRALGSLYIGLPALAMIELRGLPGWGTATILWLFGTVWATDIGGYVVGRWVGGPKLAPAISPAKTWSGAVGGLGLAILVGFGLGLGLGAASGLAVAAAAALIGLVAEAGDLLESAIKRRFGLKDSGDAIPGHGGGFDRLDSLLAAAPALLAMVALTGESPLAWS